MMDVPCSRRARMKAPRGNRATGDLLRRLIKSIEIRQYVQGQEYAQL